MSEDQQVTEGEVSREITADFILELYDGLKDIKDPEEKKTQRAAIEVLSEHLGDWLVLEE